METGCSSLKATCSIYDFYLKTTEKSSFSSKTDWITVAESDRVFSGSVTMAANAWTFILFNTPFEYDGTSNLVLVADDNSGRYDSAPHMACSVFNTSSSQAIYIYNDNTNYNPMSPPTSAGSSGYGGNTNDILSVKNHILLGIETLQPLTKGISAFTEAGGYYLLSVPVDEIDPEDVEHMIDNEYDLYAFDEAETLEWRNYKVETFNLEAGKGYLYANSEDVTLTFTGTSYSGNGEVTLSKTGDAETAGWNLVGNPFDQNAYVDRDFYVMDAEGGEIVAADRDYVEPMEGIFVVANENGETLTFSTAAPAKRSRLVLDLSQDHTVIDRAIIRFDEGRGLPKFQIKDNSTKVYIPQDGIDYAIVTIGRDVARNVSTMPVNFKAAEDGAYTLSVNVDDVDWGYLHLIDNLTGEDIDLLAISSYTFEAKTTDGVERFKVVYTAEP